MQRRGRSRHVSDAALARAASEERWAQRRPPSASSRSSSPPSSASLSPRSTASRSPTPPPTLSDQVHIAYAHDDIHLAKVLLLRLQGIEVTSDDDPRIAAVKDEDFDACFIPFGRLDDGRGEQHPQSVPKPAIPAADADARRVQRLRACERIWDTEARKFAEERRKTLVLHRMQDEQLRTRMLEQERIRLIKQKEAAAAAVDLRRRRTSRTLTFALVPAPLPPPPPPQQPRLIYDFPFTPRAAQPRRSSPTTPIPVANLSLKQEPRHQPTRVPFAQVLASMHGPLFPVASAEDPRPVTRRQRALLDALLAVNADLSFGRKGKGRARPAPCLACSPSPVLPSASPALPTPSPSASTSSTSSSSLSRAGSWLSFGGSSRASTSTSISTPPSSWTSASTLLSSSPPTPSMLSKSALTTWLPGARRTTSPSPLPPTCVCGNSTRENQCPRVLVPPSASPLPFPTVTQPLAANSCSEGKGAGEGGAAHSPSAIPFTRTLGRLLTLARGLQTAYVRAVVVGYGVGGDDGYEHEWEEREDQWEYERRSAEKKAFEPLAVNRKETTIKTTRTSEKAKSTPANAAARHQRSGSSSSSINAAVSPCSLNPPGYRASRALVQVFVSVSACSPQSTRTEEEKDGEEADEVAPVPVARLTALPPHNNSNIGVSPAPRTQLPPRLPYTTVFARPAPLPRSPWAPGSVPLPSTAGPVPCSAESARARAAVPLPAQPERDSDTDDDDAEYYGFDAPRRPVLRARPVPNSAFLRLKALHNAGGELSPTPSRRLMRECVVGLSVDNASGSGLRFVYSPVGVCY
ncbi:hypothetical protein C8J57DRAFT_10163 [Mycena rebaudengoi]|nr:hypothetical protein C8J57DRAFT_10163 [Mycena rebaudengoi]